MIGYHRKGEGNDDDQRVKIPVKETNAGVNLEVTNEDFTQR